MTKQHAQRPQAASSAPDGSTLERAVVIDATDPITGVSKQYRHLETMFGKRFVGYDEVFEMLKNGSDGRTYEMLQVRLNDGSERSLWFDITAFQK